MKEEQNAEQEEISLEQIEQIEQIDPETLAYYRRWEIKKALLGKIVMTDDGRLVAGGVGHLTRWGMGDGAAGTMFLGVTRRMYRYETEGQFSHETAVQKASAAMQDIGRKIYLVSAPWAEAVLIRHVFFRPVVLVFEEADGNLILSVHSGRSLSTIFAMKRAKKLFEKSMAGVLAV